MNQTATVHTDLVTPLGAYLRLRDRQGGSFLLESVEQGRLGRYSFVGSGSRLLTLEEAERSSDPVVGYLGYDHAAVLEPKVPLPDDGPAHAESLWVAAEILVRFDHVSGSAEVLRGNPEKVARLLGGPLPHPPETTYDGEPGEMRRFPTQAEYEAQVERAKEDIRNGEAFQIVLAQRAERPTPASALALYRALRRINPSPYLFLLEFPDIALIGSSPETLVKADGRRASLNPIAGTTTRGPGDADRLLASEKDRAEHVMLVDLGRNDLSRVCVPGSVQVERFLEPERF
jgi:anthranilate synthase component 1